VYRSSTHDVVGVLADAETSRLLEVLDATTAELARRDLAEQTDPGMREEMTVLETASRRVSARQARLVDERTRREVARRRAAGEDHVRAARKADRDIGQQLRHEHGWTPSKVKQAARNGRGAGHAGPAGKAFSAGQLPHAHAHTLFDTLQHLDEGQRSEVEPRLLDAARHQDAPTFARTCRRVLAETDHEVAAELEARRHRRRHARATVGEDGMWALTARLSGVDAATADTALKAFRRPDTPGEGRSPDQACADALVAALQAALDAQHAPADRGSRPQVVVTLDYTTLLREQGVAELDGIGPVPFDEVRRLLADAQVCRILTDPDSVPVEAGQAVRNVPIGLYRALKRRDGGCIADGCDTPAIWCDVMHLDEPYRLGGRLELRNAGLGCRSHHRLFDLGGWKITRHRGRPILHHPRRPPDPGTPVRSSPPAATTPPVPPAPANRLNGRDAPSEPTVSPAPACSSAHAPRRAKPSPSTPAAPAGQLTLPG
jgi:hypothetical protein